MSRMSELTRKPSLTTLLPQPILELEYFSEPKSQMGLPRLRKLNPLETDPLIKLVEKEFARLAMAISHDELIYVDRIRAIAVRLVQEIHRSDQIVAQVFAARPLSSRLVSNALNVAVLSTKLGMGLPYSAEDLINVTMAALVHNIEQLVVPDFPMHTTHKREHRTEIPEGIHQDFECTILKNLTDHSWLAEVAVQVYERWDGHGYPKGLKETAIHEYAQVVGLANRFETLINEEGLTGHEAMRRLLTREKTAFRGSLLKTFVQQISLFPVGTVVRLNTGEVGTVEQTNPQHPLRPILRMAHEGTRATSEASTLKDLSQDMFVHIEKAIRDPQ